MKHYMELTDGICIEAFPKTEQPEKIIEENLTLDSTDLYLQMDNKRLRKEKPIHKEDTELLKLFLQNAHRLIAERDRIMADSRMFLAPLPIRNGLAYTGTSGLHNPTLGVYIEWWSNNKCAWTEDKDGALQPIYYIAGSPLSGCNKCAYVDANGNVHSISAYPFSPVWSSFMEINNHYTEAKRLYEAYSLEEVIYILFG